MKEQNKETEKQCDIHVVSNLLPCPFCGGDVVEEKVQWNIAQALCTDCNEVWGTCGSEYEGRFDKWNVRKDQLAANKSKPEDSKNYQVAFGNNLGAIIKITDNKIEIEKAIDGWGDPIMLSQIEIIEIK